MFLLLLLVSDSMCTGNYSHLGTGTSLAVCQPDTCTLLSEVAAMREKLAAMTQTQITLEQKPQRHDAENGNRRSQLAVRKSYTMYNNNSGQSNSVASLMVNSQRVVPFWDTVGNVVQLEAGESVFVKLYANRVLYDGYYYYNTFSSFLLLTL